MCTNKLRISDLSISILTSENPVRIIPFKYKKKEGQECLNAFSLLLSTIFLLKKEGKCRSSQIHNPQSTIQVTQTLRHSGQFQLNSVSLGLSDYLSVCLSANFFFVFYISNRISPWNNEDCSHFISIIKSEIFFHIK